MGSFPFHVTGVVDFVSISRTCIAAQVLGRLGYTIAFTTAEDGGKQRHYFSFDHRMFVSRDKSGGVNR